MVNKQRGFTLVEIAIVLVIIGLLLGGILKGQELITAARVRNLSNLTAGVQTAYYGFIDRFRVVPGDMPGPQACAAIGGTACPGVGGDGDGSINSGDFPEAAAAWSHMGAAGFLQGEYSGTATNASTYMAGPPPVAPSNPWNGFLLLASTNEYMTSGTPTTRLHLIMGRKVPVNFMRELDVKIDDSSPESGVLRSARPGAIAFETLSGSETGCVSGTAPAPKIWDVAAGIADCNGYFLY